MVAWTYRRPLQENPAAFLFLIYLVYSAVSFILPLCTYQQKYCSQLHRQQHMLQWKRIHVCFSVFWHLCVLKIYESPFFQRMKKGASATSAAFHKANKYMMESHKTPLNVTKQMLLSHQQVNKMCVAEGNRWRSAHWKATSESLLLFGKREHIGKRNMVHQVQDTTTLEVSDKVVKTDYIWKPWHGCLMLYVGVQSLPFILGMHFCWISDSQRVTGHWPVKQWVTVKPVPGCETWAWRLLLPCLF